MQNKLTPSQACLDLIKYFESCDLKVYPDENGFPTIGWGHKLRPNESFLEGVTQTTADYLLRCDVQSAANDVNTYVCVQLTQNQFDACVSIFYNVGGSRLRDSHLLKCINSGDFSAVPAEWVRWDHAEGRVSNGLKTRREAEISMWEQSFNQRKG